MIFLKKIILFVFLSLGVVAFSRKDFLNSEISNNSKSNNESRGVFISYIELDKYITDDISSSKENVEDIVKRVKDLKLNRIILQVRAFQDAIYPSKIFPYSDCLINTKFDLLDYFLKECHRKKIEVYAWINPYRIRGTSDVNSISKISPAYKYIGSDIVYVGNGIYFNPSKQVVEDLIYSGVEELIDNYKVDGILFDDYFYPSNDIDIRDYNTYIKNNEWLSLNDYHLLIINKMVKRIHGLCESKNVLFGISPDGNMENNYNKNFCDIKTWLSSDQYVDFIMPQIYYGFFNEAKSFKKVLDEWSSLVTNKDIKFYIALAFYKVGEEDKYARGGKDEWILADDIIMRQIILSRNKNNYNGFSLFRYDYLLDEEKELKNVKRILK